MNESVHELTGQNTLETNPVRVVQVNWLRFMTHIWKRMSILNKLVILISITFVILQTVVGIVAILAPHNDECDKLLRAYIIVYIVKIVLFCPFNVGKRFKRVGERLLFLRRHAQEQIREEHLRLQRQRRRQEMMEQSGQPISGVPVPSSPSIASVDSTIVQPIPNWFSSLGEKLGLLAEIFTALWFFVAHVLLGMYRPCSEILPKLYFTVLAFIILGYVVLFLPLILYASTVLCLPCAKRVTQDLNITDLEALTKDSRKEEISKIPVFRYRSSDIEPQEPIEPPKKSSNEDAPEFILKIIKSYKKYKLGNVEDTATFEEITIRSTDDALCCICLSDYEHNDILCKLWCEHHFHRSCIADWFQGASKCPMCKQDFRGKVYDIEEENLAESSRAGNAFQIAPVDSNT